jgi:hypothetical protein
MKKQNMFKAVGLQYPYSVETYRHLKLARLIMKQTSIIVLIEGILFIQA